LQAYLNMMGENFYYFNHSSHCRRYFFIGGLISLFGKLVHVNNSVSILTDLLLTLFFDERYSLTNAILLSPA